MGQGDTLHNLYYLTSMTIVLDMNRCYNQRLRRHDHGANVEMTHGYIYIYGNATLKNTSCMLFTVMSLSYKTLPLSQSPLSFFEKGPILSGYTWPTLRRSRNLRITCCKQY